MIGFGTVDAFDSPGRNVDMPETIAREIRGRAATNHARDAPVLYLAEDDDDIREALTALFSHEGFFVRAAPDGRVLFEWLFCCRGPGVHPPEVIVTDHRMPGYSALDILEGLTEIHRRIPVIVITAFGREVASLVGAYGVRAVFEKPFEPDDLVAAAVACVDWGSRRGRRAPHGPPSRQLMEEARRAILIEKPHRNTSR